MDALWIIKLYSALLVFSFAVINVSSLQCWRCDTFTDEDGCWGAKANQTGSMCEDHEDVCIKIVTKFEEPHNGPRNRTAEKMLDKCDDDPLKRKVHEYVTKTCGEKKSFNHFTKTDRRCQETTIGGGGTQMRCMCSGNLCNTATHYTISSLILLGLSLTLLVPAVNSIL